MENVRCFGGRQLLRLTSGRRPAPWSLIIGENGTGKTTLLECLAWMRPVPDADGEPPASVRPRVAPPFLEGPLKPALEDEHNDTIETLSRNGSEKLALNATMSLGIGGLWPNSALQNKAQRPQSIRFAVRLRFDERSALLHLKSKGTLLDSYGLWVHDPLIATYGANRYLGDRNSVAGYELDSLNHKRLSQSTELYDVEEILMRLDYATKSDPNGPEEHHLSQLKKVIATILFQDQDDNRIKIYPPDVLETGRPSGVYVDTFTGLVRMSALSLGHRTTAGWVMDLAWRFLNWYPDSPNPLAEPAVVLIDELDLHLHPRWQLGIMKDLSSLFPATQFIATSHSPLIVQAAETANLVLLLRHENNVEIVNNPSVSRQYRVDQILTSLLFGVPNTRPQGIQLLFDRRAELMDKDERSKDEERTLRNIQRQIDQLPAAENPKDQAAMDLIRRFAAQVQDREAAGQ